MNRDKVDSILKILCTAVYEAFNLVGCLDSQKIDTIITKRFDDLLDIIPQIRVLSIEGERDGIMFSKLQNKQEGATIQIALDPIDGTKSCSLGGSRALSVLAIDLSSGKKYKRIPDSVSCFYIASNTESSFTDLIYLMGNDQKKINEKVNSMSEISSLRRNESDELWRYLIGSRYNLFNTLQGENTFYLSNIIKGPIFFAGDTSIPLFLESDNFIGRTGVSEARIEARLWKYWKGILVSGKKIKKYEGGIIGYLQRRIQASKYPGNFSLNEFFDRNEIFDLKKNGWDKTEILQMLTQEQFCPNYDMIFIASITGTEDSILCKHSKHNLDKAFLDEIKCILKIPMWIKASNFSGIIECDYNFKTGEIEWTR